MSVFQVQLNNSVQGLLDVNSVTGVENTTSIQRTMTVAGPNGIHRVLTDGQQFTDSNYWKQFAYPQMSLDQAFITVISDDGSYYNANDPEENVFPVVWYPGSAGVIGAGKGPTDTNMALDIVSTYGARAVFVQINNADTQHFIKVRLNGSTNAVFILAPNTTQVFNSGDLVISKIEFDNTTSGTYAINYVEVILSINSVSNS